MDNLFLQTDTVNELLARYGVKFGIYKDGIFKEQLFPFDSIPRVISKEEFVYLERGLKQRVDAQTAGLSLSMLLWAEYLFRQLSTACM